MSDLYDVKRELLSLIMDHVTDQGCTIFQEVLTVNYTDLGFIRPTNTTVANEVDLDLLADKLAEHVDETARRIADERAKREAESFHVVEVAKGLRMLKAGDHWVTKSMAEQFDVEQLDDVNVFGRVRLSDGEYLIGRRKHADGLALTRWYLVESDRQFRPPFWKDPFWQPEDRMALAESRRKAHGPLPLIVLADHA